MLISLVENAIRHGLEPALDGGALHLAARYDGASLQVSVTDTGGAWRRGVVDRRRRRACQYPVNVWLRSTVKLPPSPFRTTRHTALPPPSPCRAPLRRRGAPVTTALIADDEPLMLARVRNALAEAWPDLQIVAECRNGVAALEAFRGAQSPTSRFLDIRMPGKSGLEVAAEIGTARMWCLSPRTTSTLSPHFRTGPPTIC